MYSESDIDQAIEAGVMPAAVATAFRDHVAALRATPAVDEEHFRFLTGFNDIFVTIAILLLLVAAAQIGTLINGAIGALLVASLSWALALYFTARRRMALPSIVLLISFVGGVTATIAIALATRWPATGDQQQAGMLTLASAAGAVAAWAHWRRFQVPITPAAGAAAVVALSTGVLLWAVPAARSATSLFVLLGGAAVFVYAMRWDLSDPRRETRRADVAFWLHLLAAPLIAHPTFQLLGVFGGDLGWGRALLVLLLYIAFAAIALIVDRRALLVSSLAYVLYAMASLIRTTGVVELSIGQTALVIGSALLSLSAFWQPIRSALLARLGPAADRLPPARQQRSDMAPPPGDSATIA